MSDQADAIALAMNARRPPRQSLHDFVLANWPMMTLESERRLRGRPWPATKADDLPFHPYFPPEWYDAREWEAGGPFEVSNGGRGLWFICLAVAIQEYGAVAGVTGRRRDTLRSSDARTFGRDPREGRNFFVLMISSEPFRNFDTVRFHNRRMENTTGRGYNFDAGRPNSMAIADAVDRAWVNLLIVAAICHRIRLEPHRDWEGLNPHRHLYALINDCRLVRHAAEWMPWDHLLVSRLCEYAVPKWDDAYRTSTVAGLAATVLGLPARERSGFTPVLADALQDAGCEDEWWLTRLRDRGAMWAEAHWDETGVMRWLKQCQS